MSRRNINDQIAITVVVPVLGNLSAKTPSVVYKFSRGNCLSKFET